MKPQNNPCKCGECLPDAFGYYEYTTNQGKRKLRRDSRCRKCRRTARMLRRDPVADAAACKAWRVNNPAVVAEQSKKYRESEHGRRMKSKAQSARYARQKAGIQGPESAAILALYQEAQDWTLKLRSCVETDDSMEIVIHVDHIIPLARGGKHVVSNLQLLSGRENLQKGVRV